VIVVGRTCEVADVVEPSSGQPDRGGKPVELLGQHYRPERVLVAVVAVEPLLVDARAAGDTRHRRPVEPSLGELCRGGLLQSAPRPFGVPGHPPTVKHSNASVADRDGVSYRWTISNDSVGDPLWRYAVQDPTAKPPRPTSARHEHRKNSGGRALVTGANSGIGKEIARQLLSSGLSVYVGSRDAARGQAAVDELGDGARLLVLDVTNEQSVAAAAEQVAELDILVNNAGISDAGQPPTETDMDTLRRVYETNVFGVVAVTNAFLPALRRSQHPRIVNVSSGTGSLGWSTGPNPQFDYQMAGAAAAYRSSKTALNALTIYYAQALTADGSFKVNALAPGLRATNLNSRAAEQGGDPAEAAAQAVRLALLPPDGPTAGFFSWDGTVAAW